MAQAAIDTGDRPVTVSIAAERILDTRTALGLSGRFADATPRDLQVTGSVPVASGGSKTVVPADAIGVLVNVTVVTPTHEGFLSLRPQGATGEPTTSTVNFFPGAIEPNAATVDLNDGKIQIWVETSSNSGSADVLIDVVGYTVDHTHDDRYYTEGEVDTAVAAAVAPKANSADVYTKAEVDELAEAQANSAQTVRSTGFINLPPSVSTDVLTLSLEPGTYYLDAGGLVNSNSAADGQEASCTLTAGSASASKSNIVLFGQTGPGDREDISMNLVVTVAATTDAVLSCSTSGAWTGNIGFAHISSISVQSGSLSTPAAAVLATTTGEG